MAKLVWDQVGERLYETGVKNGVVYPLSSNGDYPMGYAWNGLTSVSDSPSGADPNDFWADDMKYLSIRGREEFGFTINAYMYPDEFAVCDGTAEISDGVMVGQQVRKPFGFVYISAIGNDTDFDDHGYKIHIYYNATVSPSDKEYSTINDSPEPIEFSWEATSTPIKVEGVAYADLKPVASITIDSTKVNATKLTALKNALFGTDAEGGTAATDPYLPLPGALLDMIKGS